MNLLNQRYIYASSVPITSTVVQFPDVTLTRNVTILAASGSTGPVYIGPSGMNWLTGFQLAPGTGITLEIDNLNICWGVCEAGYTGDIRYIGN